MALPELKQSTTEARLAALDLPEGGVWATEARKSALTALSSPITVVVSWTGPPPVSMCWLISFWQ